MHPFSNIWIIFTNSTQYMDAVRTIEIDLKNGFHRDRNRYQDRDRFPHICFDSDLEPSWAGASPISANLFLILE